MNYEWEKNIQGDSHIVYRLVKDKYILTYNDFFEINAEITKILYDIILILNTINFDTYYLVFNPVSLNTLSDTIFEFVIIKTTGFLDKTDIITFGESNLNTNSNDIYTFYNLSKTSLLISPCYNHNYNMNIYNNIGTFMRSSNTEQQYLLFKTVFTQYYCQLKEDPTKYLWLSTHGKGVGWLHIRIDDSPKYITYPSYRINRNW